MADSNYTGIGKGGYVFLQEQSEINQTTPTGDAMGFPCRPSTNMIQKVSDIPTTDLLIGQTNNAGRTASRKGRTMCTGEFRTVLSSEVLGDLCAFVFGGSDYDNEVQTWKSSDQFTDADQELRSENRGYVFSFYQAKGTTGKQERFRDCQFQGFNLEMSIAEEGSYIDFFSPVIGRRANLGRPRATSITYPGGVYIRDFDVAVTITNKTTDTTVTLDYLTAASVGIDLMRTPDYVSSADSASVNGNPTFQRLRRKGVEELSASFTIARADTKWIEEASDRDRYRIKYTVLSSDRIDEADDTSSNYKLEVIFPDCKLDPSTTIEQSEGVPDQTLTFIDFANGESGTFTTSIADAVAGEASAPVTDTTTVETVTTNASTGVITTTTVTTSPADPVTDNGITSTVVKTETPINRNELWVVQVTSEKTEAFPDTAVV